MSHLPPSVPHQLRGEFPPRVPRGLLTPSAIPSDFEKVGRAERFPHVYVQTAVTAGTTSSVAATVVATIWAHGAHLLSKQPPGQPW